MLVKAFKFSFSRLYIFGGQGTQQKGMLQPLLPLYSNIIQQASRQLQLNLEQITTADSSNLINKTHVSQPLIVLSHFLYFQLNGYQLQDHDYLIGHSVGEYSALLLANSITLDEALSIVNTRGLLITKYNKQESGMLVVIAKKSDIPLIHKLTEQNQLEIGCYNSQSQLVITGTKTKTNNLYNQFKANKILCTFLPVSAAFHCKQLKLMAHQFQTHLHRLNIYPPSCKILRNFDSKPYTSRQGIIEGLVKQLYNPVQFQQSVRTIPVQTQYIEIGYKPVISRFVKEIRQSMT